MPLLHRLPVQLGRYRRAARRAGTGVIPIQVISVIPGRRPISGLPEIGLKVSKSATADLDGDEPGIHNHGSPPLAKLVPTRSGWGYGLRAPSLRSGPAMT